mmetsp:Transcript_4358/g.5851  ORF Transcript_4358/g.5851 Transcript_4358/m.5851 type:complete len:455 (-) Transcript_4358:1898-3262(-)
MLPNQRTEASDGIQRPFVKQSSLPEENRELKTRPKIHDLKWKSTMNIPVFDAEDAEILQKSNTPKLKPYFGGRRINDASKVSKKKFKKGLLKLNPVLGFRRGAKRNDARGSPATDTNSLAETRSLHSHSSTNTAPAPGFSVLDQVRGKLNTKSNFELSSTRKGTEIQGKDAQGKEKLNKEKWTKDKRNKERGLKERKQARFGTPTSKQDDQEDVFSNAEESVQSKRSFDAKSAETGSAYESGSFKSNKFIDEEATSSQVVNGKTVQMREHLRKLKSEWEKEDEMRLRKETLQLLKENSKSMKSLQSRQQIAAQRNELLQERIENFRNHTQDTINQMAFKVDAIADSIDDFEQLILGHERAIEEESIKERSKWEAALQKKIKQQLEAKEEAYFDLIDQLETRIKTLKESKAQTDSFLDGVFHRCVALAISGAGTVISLILSLLYPFVVIINLIRN